MADLNGGSLGRGGGGLTASAPPLPPMRNTSRQKREDPHAHIEPFMGAGNGGWLDRRLNSRGKKSVGFVSGRGAQNGLFRDEETEQLGSSYETTSKMRPLVGYTADHQSDSSLRQSSAHAPDESEPHDLSQLSKYVLSGPRSEENFFDELSHFVDFNPPGARRDDVRHQKEGQESRERAREHVNTPPGSPRTFTSSWAALRPDDRATALLAMTQSARLDIYRNESRKFVAQAICMAISQDPESNPRLLYELDPEGRAAALCQMQVTERVVALTGLPYEDRVRTLNHMPAELIGSALAKLPAAEVLKTFKGIDAQKRPSVFPELNVSSRTAVLAWTANKSRIDLLVKLRPVDRAAALLSLPMKECCGTIRSMTPFHAECVLLEMNSSVRGEVLASIAERDLVALLSRMPVDKQISLLDGLAPQALHHTFRCVPGAGQAAVFDELAMEDRAALVARMPVKERASLVGCLASSLQANILRMLDGKDAAATLRSLRKDSAVAAMEELTSAEQAQIISCMSGKDRCVMLMLMEPYQRASIISETPSEDRAWIFRSLAPQDLAKTLSEMRPQDNVKALCAMKSSQRAEVLGCMGASERVDLALMIPPPVLASTLAEMGPADCRDVLVALPAAGRAAVILETPPALRAALIKIIMPQHRDAPSDALWQERDSEFLDTVRKLGVEALQTAIEEMSPSDRVALLLHIPSAERARLLEQMPSIECADILDSFLLEDRANTMGSLDASKAALVLAEMHPYKKAILIAAVGERDRASIIRAMATHEVGMILSALPPADCVTALRVLDAQRAANALGHMAPEERAITMEAVPCKNRAAILRHMESDEAASCLSRLDAEECAGTIRLLQDSILAPILGEIQSKARTAVLLACPIKFRVRALALLSPAALAGFLETLDALDMTATVKNLDCSVIECAMSALPLEAKVKVIGCMDIADASRMLERMAVCEAGRVLVRLPIEIAGAVLKVMDDDNLYGCLTNIEKRQRDELLTNLAQVLQVRIRKIITPSDDNRPQQAPRINGAANESSEDTKARNHNDVTGGVASLPLVIPVRRPTPPVSPAESSPIQVMDSDVAVTITMRFDEDFEWLTADEQRHKSWSQWLCGIICNAVKVSPRRIQVAGLQRGSVCLLLRCLPLSETPGLTGGQEQREDRSAMDLALQILAFASQKDVSSRLPKFLGGSLHAVSSNAKSPGSAVSPKLRSEASYSSPDRDLTEENCGVGIAFAPTPDGQYLSVIGMIPGGDADRSGLISVGDLVTTIDGQQVQSIPIAKLAQRIRGPAGSRIQIGFRSRQGGSETNIDLPRMPASGPGHGVIARTSPAAAMPSREAMTLMPMQLNFPSDKESNHSARANVYPPKTQNLHSNVDSDKKTADLDFESACMPKKSPSEGKVLRASMDKSSGHTIVDRSEVWQEKTHKPVTPIAEHDIWGTLEELDASIQRRNRDVRSFTESLLQLQTGPPGFSDLGSLRTPSPPLPSSHRDSARRSSEFFYA